MKSTPYTTTVGAMYRIKDIIVKVKLALIRRELYEISEGLYGVTSVSDDCPTFTQPLTVLETDLEGKTFVDIRPFSGIDRRTGDLVIKNKEAIAVLKTRHQIMKSWDMTGNGNDDLMNVGTLPMKAYAKYVGGNIARQRQLDPLESLNAEIISGFYYYCLFKNENSFKEMDRAKAINTLSKTFYKSVEEINDLLNDVNYIADITEFANVLKTRIESPTINVITPALIYSFLGGGWFGPYAREHILVSLEHPPTWLWLTYEAVSNRLYKQTMLGKLTQQLDIKGSGLEFTRSLDFFIRSE